MSLQQSFNTMSLIGGNNFGQNLADDIAFVPKGEAQDMSAAQVAEIAQEDRNDASRQNRLESDELEKGALAGTTEGLILSDSMASMRDNMEDKAKAERKAADDRYITILMAQIAQLDARIADIEERMGDIENRVLTAEEKAQIEALPEEERLSATDAMMREKVANGTMTQADYESWQRLAGELKDAKSEKQDLEQKIQKTNAPLQQKYEAAARESGKAIQQIPRDKRNELISSEEYRQRQDTIEQAAEVASNVEIIEQRIMKLEDIDSFKGTSEYIAKIDSFLESADAKTLAKLDEDPEQNPDVQVRLGLSRLKEELSEWDQYKGTPDYAIFVETSIEGASEAVRDALRQEMDLSAEVTAALYKPFSDSLDGEKSPDLKVTEVEKNKDNSVSPEVMSVNRPTLG